jgi:hypothetical protein
MTSYGSKSRTGYMNHDDSTNHAMKPMHGSKSDQENGASDDGTPKPACFHTTIEAYSVPSESQENIIGQNPKSIQVGTMVSVHSV